MKKFNDYINEGYREVDQINLLCDDIIEFFGNKNGDIIKRINKRGRLVAKDFVFNLPSAKLYNILLEVNDVDKLKDINKYTDKIKNFVGSSDLLIIFTNSGTAGGYDSEGKEIIINLTITTFVDKLKDNGVLLKSLNPDTYIEILKKSMKYGLKRSITHELQHAYDDYISNSKYDTDKLSNKFYDETSDVSMNYDPDYEEREYYKTYLNLPHEYWARFTETISIIGDYKDFNDLYDKFTKSFVGYDNLPIKGKKRILNSLYKYYDLKKENVQLTEGVRNLMRPKTNEELIKSIKKMSETQINDKLRIALKDGDLQTINFLLNNGADIEIVKDYPMGARHHNNMVKEIDEIIKNYKKPKKTIKSFFIKESVKDLMKGKSNDEIINIMNEYGDWKQFKNACTYGLIDIIKIILKNDTDENIHDLIDLGIRIAKRNGQKETAQFLENYKEMDKYQRIKILNESARDLMKGKDDKEVLNALNRLPIGDKFDKACEYGLIDVVKVMVKTNKDDINMERSFETAVLYDQLNIAKFLVSKGVNLNSIYSERMFEDCVESDNLIKFKFLLDLEFEFSDDFMFELAEMNAIKCLTESFKRGFEMEYYPETNLDEDVIDTYFFKNYSNEIIKIILKNSEQIRGEFKNAMTDYMRRANKIKSYLK